MKLKKLLIGLAAAALFVLLYIFGLFNGLENQIYDLFLRFRPDRKPAQELTFIDIDNNAWPRSVIADGLLRLKEYGARAAVFDIEIIDKGPRDNDQYLIQASRLFGKSWVTLNLRATPLSGEQAERRSMAEKRFSHPVLESPNTVRTQYVDILPPLPDFALSAAGAGFINVETDKDGIRRRIDLAQNIHGYWYLQLALSPLVDYLGNPAIELDNRRMYLRKAKMPNGVTKDIKIPLDGKGRMLLDWTKTDFADSYSHISFADFSLLEKLEIELEQYTKAFVDTDMTFFSDLAPSLSRIPLIIMDLEKLFDVIHPARDDALKNCSDEAFKTYVDCRRISRGLMREILNIDPESKLRALIPELPELYPNNSGAIREKAEHILTLAESLRMNLDKYENLGEKIENMVNDKFCILGSADTGTHGVVLDMILSGSFITPAGIYWQTFLALVFTALFLLTSSRFSPARRAVSGFIIIALVIVLAVLLFRFTGLFFNPLAMVFFMVTAIVFETGIRVRGLKYLGCPG